MKQMFLKKIDHLVAAVKEQFVKVKKSGHANEIILVLLLIPFIPGIVWGLVALGLMIYLMYGSEDK